MKKSINMMIAMRLIYSIFKSFIFIFVNIYLWQAGKSIQAVAVFNIFNYLGATISFYMANVIAIKNLKFNYIISSLSFLATFGLTALLGENIVDYAIVIGILGGFGDGFFFFNLNSFQADVLDKDEMDKFMSIIGGLNKASAIIIPIISGIIIERYGFIYMIDALLVLLVVQLVLSFKMPSRHIKNMGRFSIKESFRNGNYKKVLLTNTTKAPYKQFTIMANSVFLYSLMASESIIGLLNSAFSIISIAMFVLYRYMLRKISRKKLMLFGAAASSVVLVLLIKPTFVSFIVFGITIALGEAFFSTPMVGVQLNTAKNYSNNESEMLGNLMLRVIMLNIGRIIFFGLIYFFYEDFKSPIFILFLIYNLISPMYTYWLAKEEI